MHALTCHLPWVAGPEPLLSEKDVEEALGHTIIPIFRLIYAQLAGSLAALAKAVHADLHCSRKVRGMIPEVEHPALLLSHEKHGSVSLFRQ